MFFQPPAAKPPAKDAPPTPAIKGHTGLIYGLALSPDGKALATAGFDNAIKIWELGSFKEQKTLTGHGGPVYSVAYSPDGKTLASGSLDKTIRLWTLADGKFKELKGHTEIVDSVAYSPDGKALASAGADKTVRLWNPADGKEVKNLGQHGGPVF